MFRKEEQNFVFLNEIDNMALIMPSGATGDNDGEDRFAIKREIYFESVIYLYFLIISLSYFVP